MENKNSRKKYLSRKAIRVSGPDKLSHNKVTHLEGLFLKCLESLNIFTGSEQPDCWEEQKHTRTEVCDDTKKQLKYPDKTQTKERHAPDPALRTHSLWC